MTRKKVLIICTSVLLIIFMVCCYNAVNIMDIKSSVKDLSELKIIVDAGHGGSDPGTIGPITGIFEKDINLVVAQKLQAELEKQGVQVVMTRNDENAIGPTKEEDMAKREQIIEETNANMFISIHQNYFDDSRAKGPQVFYLNEMAMGKELATHMQKTLNDQLEGDRMPITGNYRLLKPGIQPSIIVECGFFSNPQEEKLLQDDEYQDELVCALIEGIKSYISS